MKMRAIPKFQRTWRGQLSDYVTAIAHSPNGQFWAACSAAGEVRLFSATTFEAISLQDKKSHSVDCLAFSQDGQFLAIGGQDGKVKIWRVPPESPEPIGTLDNPSTWIDRLSWSPTTNQLTFCLGKYAQVWDAEGKEVVTTLNFEASSVLDLDWRRDGNYIALAGYQGGRVWKAQDWDADPKFLEVPSVTVAIAWSPDGKYIASGNIDGTLIVNEWGNPHPWVMGGFSGKVRQLAWSEVPTHIGVPLLASCSGEEIVVWQRSQNERIGWSGQVVTHEGKIQAIAFQPQNLLLASAGEDGWVYLWHRGQQLVQSLNGAPNGFSCLSWHPAGHQLIAGGQSGEILIWSQIKQGQGFSI